MHCSGPHPTCIITFIPFCVSVSVSVSVSSSFLPHSKCSVIDLSFKKVQTYGQFFEALYIIDTLKRFDIDTYRPVSTPMDPGLRLSADMGPKTQEDIIYMKDKLYLNAVGSLMYLALTTRPDMAYYVGVLACFSANPGPEHC